jgi:capsule biosynthesis phosphatase
MNRIVIDLDGTLCTANDGDYANATPHKDVINKLNIYRSLGFIITIHTSRNMRTYNNNLGRINVDTLPTIITWLLDNQVPYDEIHVGKPWCGPDGFYVDDRSVRPSEFQELSPEDIRALLS